QVLPKISQVLKIQQDPTKKTFSSLADFISDREILLLLDNFEHVMDAAFQLNKLLGSCPNLKILVTSRIVLNINGEYEYPVPQLPLPQRDKYHSIKELQAIPSVQLLVTRARAIKPTFELTNKNKRAIIEICIKLDGLPLALELAAARIKIFSPEALNKRLSFNFDLLSSNSENTPDRHKTLRNAIDWSYSLLSVEEQTLFRRLSVFSGGCNIEAAQDVCFRDYLDNLDIIDSLSGLVNKSLLQQEEQYDGEPRFFMLETIKAFGQEKLKLSLEEDLIMQRYIAFFLSLLEEAKQNLTGPEQGNWLDLLELELDNIRSILTWAEGRSDVEMGLKVTVAVWRFWTIRSMVREGAQWMSRLLSLAKEQSETKLHCRALNAYGMMFSLTNNISDSFQVFNDSLRIARKLDYREGLAEVLNHLGWVYHFDCQFDLSEQYSNEAMQIQKELGNQRGISVSYNNLAVVAAFRGQMKSSFDLYNKSKSIRKEIGDIRGYAYSLINQAWIEIFMGKYFKSNQNTSLGIEILSKLSDTQLLAWAKTVRALNLFHMGKLKASKNLALEAQPLWEKSGTHTGLLRAKVIYLLCRLREYDFSGLKRELADLMENSGRVAKVLIFDIRYAMALLSLYKKDEEQAYEYSRENLRHILTVGSHIYTCDNLELISYLSLRKKNSKTALKLYSTASILRNKLQMPIPQVLQSFHHDLNRQLVSHFDTVTYDTLWKQGQALDARSCMRLLR
ncbi:MAG: tetratricopeptide repeat protein, partial [Saprospiraceae bacterium]|nr:tetratricopeptide repeat protein [Saprospiraceae bacterium]